MFNSAIAVDREAALTVAASAHPQDGIGNRGIETDASVRVSDIGVTAEFINEGF